MRRAAVLAVLAACGGGHHRASPEQLAQSKSLGCVLAEAGKQELQGDDLFEPVADQAPPAMVRAIALAIRAHPIDRFPALDYEAAAAIALAQRGEVDDARALLDLPELAALPDEAEIGLGVELGEVRMRVGRPAHERPDRALIGVRARALGGDVAGAARDFAQVDESRLGVFDTVPHATALAALGRDDDAFAVIAAADPGKRYYARLGVAEVAVGRRKGLAAAVDELVRNADQHAVDWGEAAIVLRELIAPARTAGLSAEIAPLRRQYVSDLVDTPQNDQADRFAVDLADELETAGATDELAALQPALDRIHDDLGLRSRLTAIDALHHDTLDSALAALQNAVIAGPALWLRLWIRAQLEGDAGFDARLAAATCPAE